MAGSLRSTGIEIYFNRADHQGRRVISVKSASLVPERSSASSASSAPWERRNLAEIERFDAKECAENALQDLCSYADGADDADDDLPHW